MGSIQRITFIVLSSSSSPKQPRCMNSSHWDEFKDPEVNNNEDGESPNNSVRRKSQTSTLSGGDEKNSFPPEKTEAEGTGRKVPMTQLVDREKKKEEYDHIQRVADAQADAAFKAFNTTTTTIGSGRLSGPDPRIMVHDMEKNAHDDGGRRLRLRPLYKNRNCTSSSIPHPRNVTISDDELKRKKLWEQNVRAQRSSPSPVSKLDETKKDDVVPSFDVDASPPRAPINSRGKSTEAAATAAASGLKYVIGTSPSSSSSSSSSLTAQSLTSTLYPLKKLDGDEILCVSFLEKGDGKTKNREARAREEVMRRKSVDAHQVGAAEGLTCTCHCIDETAADHGKGSSTTTISSHYLSEAGKYRLKLKLLIPAASAQAAMNLFHTPAVRTVFHEADFDFDFHKHSSNYYSDFHNNQSYYTTTFPSLSRLWCALQRVIIVYTPHTLVVIGLIMFALSLLGAYTFYSICTRKRCSCGLCGGKYKETDFIVGEGAYGTVHLIEMGREQLVAKMIAVDDITVLDEHQREAKQLLVLSSHKNIVSYVDDFVHVEFGSSFWGAAETSWGHRVLGGPLINPRNFCVIIQEYCSGGDLRDQILNHYSDFTEDKVNIWFQELVSAIEHLHSKNIIHRDVKSQNVFLASDGSVRLGDFGLSCRQTANGQTRSWAGTDCYAAPEVLMTMQVGVSMDVWALGCVLMELITGQFMWDFPGSFAVLVLQEPSTTEKLLKKYNGNLKAPKLVKIMKKLLNPTVSERPQAPDISAMVSKNMQSKKGLQSMRFGAFSHTGKKRSSK